MIKSFGGGHTDMVALGQHDLPSRVGSDPIAKKVPAKKMGWAWLPMFKFMAWTPTPTTLKRSEALRATLEAGPS